jgi:hypothetical protein
VGGVWSTKSDHRLAAASQGDGLCDGGVKYASVVAQMRANKAGLSGATPFTNSTMTATTRTKESTSPTTTTNVSNFDAKLEQGGVDAQGGGDIQVKETQSLKTPTPPSNQYKTTTAEGTVSYLQQSQQPSKSQTPVAKLASAAASLGTVTSSSRPRTENVNEVDQDVVTTPGVSSAEDSRNSGEESAEVSNAVPENIDVSKQLDGLQSNDDEDNSVSDGVINALNGQSDESYDGVSGSGDGQSEEEGVDVEDGGIGTNENQEEF